MDYSGTEPSPWGTKHLKVLLGAILSGAGLSIFGGLHLFNFGPSLLEISIFHDEQILPSESNGSQPTYAQQSSSNSSSAVWKQREEFEQLRRETEQLRKMLEFQQREAEPRPTPANEQTTSKEDVIVSLRTPNESTPLFAQEATVVANKESDSFTVQPVIVQQVAYRPVITPDPVELVQKSKAEYRTGREFFSSGDYQSAIDHFDLAANIEGSNPLIYYFRGLARHRLGVLIEAMADFGLGAEREPVRSIAVSNALEPIQGTERATIERLRPRLQKPPAEESMRSSASTKLAERGAG